jgi:hypothetical protein
MSHPNPPSRSTRRASPTLCAQVYSNVPAPELPPDRFVGRSEPLSRLVSELCRTPGPLKRVLHIRGEPGAGKTELVRQAASSESAKTALEGGLFYCLVSGAVDPTGGKDSLASLLARTFNVRVSPDNPVGDLATFLKGPSTARPLLLILDMALPAGEDLVCALGALLELLQPAPPALRVVIVTPEGPDVVSLSGDEVTQHVHMILSKVP